MTKKEFLNAVSNGKVDVIQIFLDALTTSKANYCVIGGLAVNAYAEPVVSLDLDVIVAADKVEEVSAAAEARGLKAERFEHSLNLTSDKSDLAYVYRAKVSRQKITRSRVKRLLQQLYDGAAGPLVLELIRSERLTPQEIDELQKLIDRLDATGSRKPKP